MKTKHFFPILFLSAALVLSSILSFAIPSEMAMASDRSSFVICIDPGHDDSQPRETIQVSGINETTYNLNISLALRDYLQSYGFTVYMTRTDGTCPSGGGSERACLQARADYAAAVGANLLVSIHHNATSSDIYNWHDASGSAIYTSLEYITLTSKLAAKVSLALYNYCGLPMRTPTGYARASADNGYYADGIVKDYYGVIRHCAEYNIPAVIIEHGFSDNYYDSTQRKTLGADCYALADATAILSWYEEVYEGTGTATVVANTDAYTPQASSESSADSSSAAESSSGTSYSIGSSSGVPGYVNIADASLYASANSSSNVLCSLLQNDTVTVFEDDGDFCHVTAYHSEKTYDGYISKSLITVGSSYALPEGVAACVNTESLNLRSAPSGDSAILTQLTSGDCLTLYEHVNGFYHVAATHDGLIYMGYISAAYVQIGSYTVTGYVSKGYQDVTQQPDSSSTVVEVLTSGAPVSVLSEENGWYEVQFEKSGNILTGYVPADSITQY